MIKSKPRSGGIFYVMPSAFRLQSLSSCYNNTMPSALKMNCHGALARGLYGKIEIGFSRIVVITLKIPVLNTKATMDCTKFTKDLVRLLLLVHIVIFFVFLVVNDFTIKFRIKPFMAMIILSIQLKLDAIHGC